MISDWKFMGGCDLRKWWRSWLFFLDDRPPRTNQGVVRILFPGCFRTNENERSTKTQFCSGLDASTLPGISYLNNFTSTSNVKFTRLILNTTRAQKHHTVPSFHLPQGLNDEPGSTSHCRSGVLESLLRLARCLVWSIGKVDLKPDSYLLHIQPQWLEHCSTLI